MLIDEYFQEIETYITDCPSVIESHLIKDKRSLHIGIIEGQIYFMDGSVLFFIEFVNVKVKQKGTSIPVIIKTKLAILSLDMIWHPITKRLKAFPIINI